MERIVIEADCEERVDSFIASATEFSRSHIANLADSGGVLVNGKSVKKNFKLKDGDKIEIELPDAQTLDITPEDIPLDIVYEDDDIIVVNKPQGMVVHPAPGNYSGTLVNALMYHCGSSLSGINGVIRPGIVHRIDKDTSGLLVVAKNDKAHMYLAEQLKEKKANRRYLALALGRVNENGTIDKPIGRSQNDRKKMAIVPNGRNAVTHYEPVEKFLGYTLLECVLETGRTHQIRVHLASIGHPIAGDKVYGAKNDKIKSNGQLLFAKTLGFNHPKTGEYMEFSALMPSYFEEILKKLRKE